jgi:pimeloyl-ACP methyl ester carboxylesterase
MQRESNLMMQTDDKGQGAPLVLVGGGLTGWESWRPFQARLADARRVVIANPLSVQFGLENRRLPPSYSVKMESRALEAALDARSLAGPVDLVAWSYGAAISLDYALDHPDRVRTLTLIEPPAFWVLQATGRMDAQSQREMDELRALYAQMTEDVSEGQLGTFVRQAGLVPPGASPSDLPSWPAWVKHRRSLRAGDAPFVHTDDDARLRAFDRRVLLLKGTGSSHFLHAIQDALAASLPRAKLLELPGGHAPQMVATDRFLVALADFQASDRAPQQ